MNLKKQFLIAFLFCSLTAICGIAFLFYQNEKEVAQKLANEQSNHADLQLAKQKLREWQPFYALDLVKKHLDEIYQETAFSQEWLNISLQAGSKLHDSQFLVNLYNWEKSLFLQHEEAALVVAEQMIDQERRADFSYLKNHWQRDSNLSEKWTILDADYCARCGDSQKAVQLLSAKKFKHPFEVDRLVRLAFLNLNEHPQVSWQYLSQACKLEPENPDLRIYRAHFLNSMGKQQLAVEEIQNSLYQHSDNTLLKEELIEQQIRNKNYLAAVALFNENLSMHTGEDLWLKALFLNKVVAPIKIRQELLLHEKLNPEIVYFLGLKEGSYFDETQENDYFARAELDWMQLIHLLKLGKEEKAYRLALASKSLDTYQPDLRNALIRTLAFRNPFITAEELIPSQSDNFLFKQLENPPYSDELYQLLASDEALSALFLAAGWNEAALQLRATIENAHYDLPEWYTLGITQALAQNHSIEQAIGFAKQQKPSHQLALLLGELYIKTGNSSPAIAIFKKLSLQNDSIGEKAAYHLANEYLEQGKLHLAKKALVMRNTWQTPQGRLILARIALKLGDNLGAESIFATIAHTSPEAKSYLASKAFYEKDYRLAYTLTEDLFKQNPGNKELKQNLRKISQAAKQSQL